ncbi:hypothetical protein [Thiocapsa marina]|uniref:Uncharacterized protein n=1 Tax=Thiocapsa marina 5811 TaxID=768671 RepID=F9U7M9_9GAMM|nr:hypothetical protein [Thiocapsa marina]EGV19659.1 hypothetical protein ThimaDRAFT_1105 [Thiocapsa marina 5811]
MQIRIEAIILTLEPFEILARHAWSEHERFDLYADEERISEAIGDFAGAKDGRLHQLVMDQPRGGPPACPPTLDGGTPEAELLGGFPHTRAGSAEQNDPGPRHEALRRACWRTMASRRRRGLLVRSMGAATQWATTNRPTQRMASMDIMLPRKRHKRYQDFRP